MADGYGILISHCLYIYQNESNRHQYSNEHSLNVGSITGRRRLQAQKCFQEVLHVAITSFVP